MPDLIILRGAPGVGKSTLSTEIKNIFKKGVTVEIGSLLKMVNGFEDGNSKLYSDTIENARSLGLNYLRKGYSPVLIIGPFKSARIQNHFLNAMDRDIKYLIISLVAKDEDLNYRIDQRLTGFKDKNIAYAVNKDIINFSFENEIRFDTSVKTSEEIFIEIKHILTTVGNN